MNNNKDVYLAGPIAGCSYEGCADWRHYMCRELVGSGIRTLSPLRCKYLLKNLSIISGSGEEYAEKGPLYSARGVLTRDRFDATRCGVLCVNLLGARKVSIGTVMEIAWADLIRTPIVCAIESSGNVHEHLMLREAVGFRVTSLDEAVKTIKAILL